MDLVALGCIALAAVLHATWNILLKAAGDPLRTATVGMVAASLVALPLIVTAWALGGRPDLPAGAWAAGLASSVAEVAFFVFLAAAYRRGDLSIVYPLARGSAPLYAIAVGVLLLGERLVPGAWLGVALLLAGLVVVQRPWRIIRLAGRDRAGAGFALLAGVMIATYTSLDRIGVGYAPAWLYLAIIWPVGAAGLVVVDRIRPRIAGGRYAPEAGTLDMPRAVVGGLFTLAAYGLVLLALSRAPLAVVAPLRESAVLLASVWGVVRLREAVGRREVGVRLAGSGLVLAGAVALAVAR